jgi:hypothetical protein
LRQVISRRSTPKEGANLSVPPQHHHGGSVGRSASCMPRTSVCSGRALLIIKSIVIDMIDDDIEDDENGELVPSSTIRLQGASSNSLVGRRGQGPLRPEDAKGSDGIPLRSLDDVPAQYRHIFKYYFPFLLHSPIYD